MNWSDERYVRLYTRDTVTWKRWKWETRAVLSLLLRKVDRAGVLDTGDHDKVEAFALLLEVPVEVAALAIAELLASGTMTESAGGYLLPTFIEAQEATQTDAARQRESRGKRRAANMRNDDGACHAVSHAVTSGHTVSQAVTPAVPNQPCLAVPEKHVRASPAAGPDVDALQAAWNELTTAPIARWQAGREKLAKAALKRRPLEQWREVFTRINASSFCRGADGGWIADIDWALRAEGKKPETALKVLEGAFDRGSRAPPGVTSNVMPSAVEASTQVTTGF